MEELQILWINRAYTKPGNGVRKHSHSYYHMFIVLSGTMNVTVGDLERTVSSGQTLLVPPRTDHSYINPYQESIDCIEIKFTVTSPGLDRSLQEKGEPLFSDDPLIVGLGKKIREEYYPEGKPSDEVMKDYLKAILGVMTQKQRKNAAEAALFGVEFFSDLTKKVLYYLEQHYSEPFSLDEMAGELSFNKSYLCTSFKKETGRTIMDCLNIIRIRNAAKLLSYSERSINDVSRAVGFSSPSQLNHVFQRFIGTTPSAIRRAYPQGILMRSDADPVDQERPDKVFYNALAGETVSVETMMGIRLNTKGD